MWSQLTFIFNQKIEISYYLSENIVHFSPSLHHRLYVFLPNETIGCSSLCLPLILSYFQIFLWLLLLTNFYSVCILIFLVFLLHSWVLLLFLYKNLRLLSTLSVIFFFFFSCPNLQVLKAFLVQPFWSLLLFSLLWHWGLLICIWWTLSAKANVYFIATETVYQGSSITSHLLPTLSSLFLFCHSYPFTSLKTWQLMPLRQPGRSYLSPLDFQHFFYHIAFLPLLKQKMPENFSCH